MTSYFSARVHIASIVRKIHFSLHRLKFHRTALSMELRINLISSLIFPLIDYCCLVYNDPTAEQNLKIQRLLNSGIRFIDNLRKDEHIRPILAYSKNWKNSYGFWTINLFILNEKKRSPFFSNLVKWIFLTSLIRVIFSDFIYVTK